MADVKYVDMQKRKLNFQSRIEPFSYGLLILIIIFIMIINIVKKGLFTSDGWLSIGLFILFFISFRNYFFIKQLSPIEFLKPDTYRRFQAMILLPLVGFILVTSLIPSTFIRDILPDSIPSPIDAIFYFLLGLALGTICIAVNLHIPMRSRDLELAFEEKEQVKKWRKNLDKEWEKFREVNEEELQKFSNPDAPPTDISTLTIIRERMDSIVKFLHHVRRNQYVIIARHDITGNKLVQSQVTLRFLFLISIIVAIKIFTIY